jgi:hypothetical protein
MKKSSSRKNKSGSQNPVAAIQKATQSEQVSKKKLAEYSASFPSTFTQI